ncbi:TetR/AcrR family transcriptional regulator [Streptomyces roseolilacinus]|uniref:TetR family transcriptional regulator n=1 Tax=Streptomyces roseolilacinus TaxID=66904 RepID=A0A918EKC6_9ACTN|nr:TetR/AcrR family transcriptional regulator [Streptomyces roseolilacinus]GGP97692.1 TetR family transcriptional regulator [Streptomyces roseolilacinus]
MTRKHEGEAGGPRRRAEIFTATLDMLGSLGYDSLTIEGVAQHSGVNKTTIYRWWSSKSELLRDALLHSHMLRFELPDTGSLRGDLTELAERVQALLDDEHRRTIVEAALVGAVRHQAMRELVVSFLDDRFGRHQPVFERAMARGDLPHDADPALLVDAMAGALWMRVLVRRGDVADTYTRDLVDMLMDGVQKSATLSGRPAR